jgi:hypothetical protein
MTKSRTKASKKCARLSSDFATAECCRQQSLEAVFDHHLPKPVPLADLEKLLRSGS